MNSMCSAADECVTDEEQEPPSHDPSMSYATNESSTTFIFIPLYWMKKRINNLATLGGNIYLTGPILSVGHLDKNSKMSPAIVGLSCRSR